MRNELGVSIVTFDIEELVNINYVFQQLVVVNADHCATSFIFRW